MSHKYRHLLLVWLCLFVVTPVMADEEMSLSDEKRSIFWGTVEDPAPKKLEASRRDLEGRHYLAGDEWNLHKFYPVVKEVGGAYMGVGTDQGYLFTGWMKSEFSWLIDYDPWVVMLHQAYGVFFREAETKEAFGDFWRKENRKSSQKLLRERLKDHPKVKRIVRIFRYAQNQTYYRFLRLRRILKRDGVPSYLTDDAQYAYVRQMVLSGRLRPLLVNLLDDEGMVGVAEASQQLKVPVRALYVSNAEGYWPYRDQFRKNMWAQYVDEKSHLLRTVPKKRQNKDYIYYAQPMTNYGNWLRQPFVRKVYDIIPRIRIKGEKHIPYLLFDKEPFERKKKRR